uniref:Uncharacterized protein n=1 Tax=Globodera rostochiensis TaxID=31243 RepID=A0A914ICT0_GLORO
MKTVDFQPVVDKADNTLLFRQSLSIFFYSFAAAAVDHPTPAQHLGIFFLLLSSSMTARTRRLDGELCVSHMELRLKWKKHLKVDRKRTMFLHNFNLHIQHLLTYFALLRSWPVAGWGIAAFKVSHVIKEANAVFVEGLHTKLVDKYNKERMKKMDIDLGFFDQWEEQPLFVHKGEVQLVDPNDGDPCTAKWVLNDSKTQYERVSNRTGFIIPLPNRAFTSYEYISPATYLEVLEKDTPADVVLKRTYMPKLCTFEQEIEEEMKLEKRSEEERPPTYWY